MNRQSALVICPGRGTYNRQELGYLAKNHQGQQPMLSEFDARRDALGQPSLTELDSAATYSTSRLTRGDNASSLIYACAYADFLSINRNKFDIVGVAGNSMGWYIALACAGALRANHGFEVVNTMGTLMQDALIGGQLLYPYVDENWIEIPHKRDELIALTHRIADLYLSIQLGGMIVFAGTESALKTCEQALEPIQDRFPMRLHNHAAFHSPLQQSISVIAKEQLKPHLFQQPTLPLIDGRGHVWQPQASNQADLWDYTLEHQVVTPFDFQASVRSSLHEFAPDNIIVLGPGQTLGGAIAQCLIAENWQGIRSKQDFIDRQTEQPFLLSMGIDEQRTLVI
ncbi:MAG: [acyl-carrier-protein] S-malonyltransferase [Gammaproteobacteria bacterium]|jgi:acyl transferase domain-containing protein